MTEKWLSYLNGCIRYPYLEHWIPSADMTELLANKHDGITGYKIRTSINSVR